MARGKQAYLDHLRNVPLFSACSTKDLQKIASATDEISLPAGYKLTDQGAMGKEAFVIMDGTVTVSRNGKKVATLGAGDVVGELSLLDHGPRTATVIADTPVTVLSIQQNRFMPVLDQVPAMSHKLLANLAARIRDLDRKNYG
jgi:CRP/FNR family cyclic AMP-dependent transcriptional regulator